jgi:hypothetical protein
MNIAAIICALLAAATTALGQGIVLFQNHGTGLSYPVRLPDGSLAPAGEYSVELWVGSCPDALSPVHGSTLFLDAPGLFSGIVSVPNFAGGSRPYVRYAAWDNRANTIKSHAEAVEAGADTQLSPVWQVAWGLKDANSSDPPPLFWPYIAYRDAEWDLNARLTITWCPHEANLVLNIEGPGSWLQEAASVALWESPLESMVEDFDGWQARILRVAVETNATGHFFRVQMVK